MLLATACAALVQAMRLHVREVQLPCPEAVSGWSVVQLSGTHIGSRRPSFLQRVVRMANQLEPDLAVITGYLVDSRAFGNRTSRLWPT